MGESPKYKRRTKAELLAEGQGHRVYGSGAVFQTKIRGQDVWRAYKVVQDSNGQRKKVSGTGKTATHALERLELNLNKHRGELLGGVAKPSLAAAKASTKKRASTSKPMFTDVAWEWLEWRKYHYSPERAKKPIGPQVANQYKLIIENQIGVWGIQPIEEISKEDLKQFVYWTLEERNLSNSHTRAIQGVVFQVFAYAADRNFIKKNVARDLKMSPRDKEQRYAQVKSEDLANYEYVPDRVMAFLAPNKSQADFVDKNGQLDSHAWLVYQRHSTYEARWALASLLALRPAETLGLTWDCIRYLDQDGTDEKRLPQVAIVQQLARNPEPTDLETKLYLKPNPKTPAGERSLPLSPELVQILRRWKQTQMVWKKSAEWNPYPHLKNLVFTTKTGKPIRQQDDNVAWKQILSGAFRSQDAEGDHIRSLRLYSLRHLAITRMLRMGGQLATISEIAGHASVVLTHEVYGHLGVADKVKPLSDLSSKTMRERRDFQTES